MTDKRKTVTRRRISRKIQPAQFESLEISVEVEDEFEWSTFQERDDKLSKHTKMVLDDFNHSFVTVCNALGITSHKALIAYKDAHGNTKTGAVKDDLDTFADELK